MSAKRLKVWDFAPADWEKYDICLVFPIDPTNYRLPPEAMFAIKNLVKLLGRRYIYAFYSDDSTRIYLLVRTRLKLLRAKAHSEGWMLPLDEEVCQVMAYAGNEGDLVSSFAVPHRPDISSLPPFKFLYARYVNEEAVDHLYSRKYNMRHPFHKTLRIKMLIDFLRRNPMPEHDLALDHLVESKVALHCFAVHDVAYKNKLAIEWLSLMPAYLPVERIRDYFGEKIAIYFALMDYLFFWMLPISIVGIGFEIPALMFNNFSRPEIPAFSYTMLLYMIVSTQHWKRQQQLCATKWNSLDCNLEDRLTEHKRYNYYGMKIMSFIDGRETVYFLTLKRSALYFFSALVLLLSLAISLIGVTALYYARWRLYYTEVRDYAQWITSGATAVQIMICNRLFFSLTQMLSEMENHRTDREYENSMILKLYFFQVTNTLSSFYYLAFAARNIKGHHQTESSLGECGFDNCMQPLAINTVTVLCTLLLYRVLVHYLPPLFSFGVLSNCCGYYKEQRYNDAEVMQPILSLDNHLPSGEERGDDIEEDQPRDFHNIVQNLGGDYDARGNENNENAYENIYTEGDDIDQEDLGDRHEGRTLHSYLKKQKTNVSVKESRAESHNARRSIPLSPLGRSPGRAESELSHIHGLERVPSEDNKGANSSPNSRAVNNTRKFDQDTIDINIDEEEDENVGERVENPFLAPRRPYNTNIELMRNYSYLLNVFAIVLCFGSSLPASYVLLAVFLYVENRGQAWQLLYLYPRTLPQLAENIGLWAEMIDTTLAIAVVTNASLIILTMKQFEHWDLTYRLLLWIGIVSTLMTSHAVLSKIYSTVPEETIIQKQRGNFIASKLIDRLPDKEDTLPIDML